MRALRCLVVLALAATLLTGHPARADTRVCAGTGTMHTEYPLFYPGMDLVLSPPPPPRVITRFVLFLPTIGTCQSGLVFDGPAQLAGIVIGQCGAATGFGTDQSGHDFSFVWAGAVVVYTGEVPGLGALYADSLSGESCFSPGADRFLAVAAFGSCHGSPVTTTPGDTYLAGGYSSPAPIPIYACV